MSTDMDPQVLAGLLAVLAALIGAAGHLGAAYIQRPREPYNPAQRLLCGIADRLGGRREPTFTERLAAAGRFAAPVALAVLGAVLILWR